MILTSESTIKISQSIKQSWGDSGTVISSKKTAALGIVTYACIPRYQQAEAGLCIFEAKGGNLGSPFSKQKNK